MARGQPREGDSVEGEVLLLRTAQQVGCTGTWAWKPVPKEVGVLCNRLGQRRVAGHGQLQGQEQKLSWPLEAAADPAPEHTFEKGWVMETTPLGTPGQGVGVGFLGLGTGGVRQGD